MATQTMTAVDRLADLERLRLRLEDGFDKIAEASRNGQDTTRWEDVWLDLLRQYQELHDALNGSDR